VTIDRRTIEEVAPLIKDRRVSPSDLVRDSVARIESRPEINAFITVLADRALQDARRAAEEIAGGRYRGPLHGVPVSVKDLIDVAGTRTTSGSALPAPEATADAPIVTKLREAGAIIIGKTNLHEFAFGTTSEESAFGPVRNPIDTSRSAGGSSGGAAAALADGMCYGSVGTDTGGSIRIPAAACGVVGLKPTAGELSLAGVVPLSATLDHIGPMARTVTDAALLFYAMKGLSMQEVAPAGGRLSFGVPRAYFCDRLDEDVTLALDASCRRLASAGHVVGDLDINRAAATPDVYLHIVLPEASWYHAPLLERHAASYSPGVRLRLEMGRYVLAEDYVRAMRLRHALTQTVDRALDMWDALLLPALPVAAPPLGATTVEAGGTTEPVRAAMLRLTQLFNITGHPAIVLPASRGRDGLPRALQLVGRRGQTERLLDVAAAAEPYITTGPGSVGGGTG
jgi:aspartyl-tRNA(Asn)/glutamyl-tRNA(Gln) amidotransferase subunit A